LSHADIVEDVGESGDDALCLVFAFFQFLIYMFSFCNWVVLKRGVSLKFGNATRLMDSV